MLQMNNFVNSKSSQQERSFMLREPSKCRVEGTLCRSYWDCCKGLVCQIDNPHVYNPEGFCNRQVDDSKDIKEKLYKLFYFRVICKINLKYQNRKLKEQNDEIKFGLLNEKQQFYLTNKKKKMNIQKLIAFILFGVILISSSVYLVSKSSHQEQVSMLTEDEECSPIGDFCRHSSFCCKGLKCQYEDPNAWNPSGYCVKW
ncbi:transmembrane protein, putative (macronuclear) [Tetrahymena thermophila SB210]|uniref:Transmembrane protein, putative n=1 Tax=Tetrahymena thermophila (strain SB210) TaxID=312017 RepID=I7MFT4_TETTS|nr:transmembrane protein, putative [Tetrahymena thermophila SB210]EAR84283.2 transmembrane protein, putative [Tetrahymena thermophila SB210]|eukprot:XP_001031946.2 transmembrane protein, putative [Tetrahymena thermophila SB210]